MQSLTLQVLLLKEKYLAGMPLNFLLKPTSPANTGAGKCERERERARILFRRRGAWPQKCIVKSLWVPTEGLGGGGKLDRTARRGEAQPRLGGQVRRDKRCPLRKRTCWISGRLWAYSYQGLLGDTWRERGLRWLSAAFDPLVPAARTALISEPRTASDKRFILFKAHKST